jgi:hypothetical protein
MYFLWTPGRERLTPAHPSLKGNPLVVREAHPPKPNMQAAKSPGDTDKTIEIS